MFEFFTRLFAMLTGGINRTANICDNYTAVLERHSEDYNFESAIKSGARKRELIEKYGELSEEEQSRVKSSLNKREIDNWL